MWPTSVPEDTSAEKPTRGPMFTIASITEPLCEITATRPARRCSGIVPMYSPAARPGAITPMQLGPAIAMPNSRPTRAISPGPRWAASPVSEKPPPGHDGGPHAARAGCAEHLGHEVDPDRGRHGLGRLGNVVERGVAGEAEDLVVARVHRVDGALKPSRRRFSMTTCPTKDVGDAPTTATERGSSRQSMDGRSAWVDMREAFSPPEGVGLNRRPGQGPATLRSAAVS